MIRPAVTEIGLFFLPFAVYALILLGMHAGLMQPKAWSLRRVSGLIIVSLVLVIGSFVILAQFSGAPPDSNYVPAHIEGGKLVPGSTR